MNLYVGRTMSKVLAELTAMVPSITEPETKTTQKPSSIEDKWKALKAVEKSLNEQFKTTASLVRLGTKVGKPMPSIATGIYTLDFDVIGTGGIPRGRIIEIIGPESSGKTTFALHCVGQEQKRGEICAYVDAEHALDPSYMSKLGVDVNNLVVSQPDSGEQALETVEALVESRAVSLIVVDSVAALVPQAELNGEMGDSHMGLQARLMSQAMRKLRGKCSMNGVTVLFINQIREKIGVMYGSPETTPGGRALKFYSSVRLDVRKVGGEDGTIKSGNVVIGHKIRIRAIKNKVGTPARSTEIDLIYGQGLDLDSDFISYAVNIGAIEKSGAWFKFKGENIGQGLEKTIANIKSDDKLMAAIQKEVTKAQTEQRDS